MSRRAWLYGAGIALTLWILIVLFWHYLMVALAGVICWRLLAHRMGFRRRPRATWARNVTAVSAAFAAWNTRWLKPRKFVAKAKAAGVPLADPYDDEIPF